MDKLDTGEIITGLECEKLRKYVPPFEYIKAQAKLNNKEVKKIEDSKDEEIGIGNLDQETLEAKKVIIFSSTVQEVGKDKKTKIVQLLCKHPDEENPIKITRAKISVSEDQLKTVALWVNKDAEGNLQKDSPLVKILNFVGAKTIKDLEGKAFDTVTESKESKFLCIKAY